MVQSSLLTSAACVTPDTAATARAAAGEMVKLTIHHEIDAGPDSKFLAAVSGGWPKVLSSLKSLLETGNALEPTWDNQGCAAQK